MSLPLSGLIAYYRCDEASGDLLDAHDGHHMTETGGSIGTTTGKIASGRDFVATDTEHFLLDDSPAFSMGDIAFTVAGWVKFDSLSGFPTVVCKDNLGASSREWGVYYHTGTGLRFYVSANGSSLGVATSSVTISTGTTYFFAGWHDPDNDKIGTRVNATEDTADYSLGVFDGSAGVSVGSRTDDAAYFDGMIDELGVWKSLPNRDTLYNGGDGVTYPDAAVYETFNPIANPIRNPIQNPLRYS